ncbi:MAG: GNAT family N-acetyltransferase, partial [Candidatus Limnocylindrales bacterium]
HADYATVLVDPVNLPDVARALVGSLAAPPDPDHGDRDWDVVDLRRWRQGDPALHALAMAFRDAKALNDWTVALNAEDVCPIVTLPEDGGWDDYLATLEKKARHEIRRKIRRAEREGEIVFTSVEPTPENVEAFITLHQARWGDQGLFPQTEGGQRSRHFFHRIAELESAEGVNRQLEFGRVTVGGLLIFATVAFDDGATSYFYNAGMDPEARDLSPGVTGTAAYLKDHIDAGRRRFDFLRGNEPYKYEWGAVDEPIYRLLVTRS